MHDLDDSLDRAIGARFGALHGSVAAAVTLPGAEEIIARGRRRRRNGQAAVGGLAVLVVVLVGYVLVGPLRGGGTSPPAVEPSVPYYRPPSGAVRPALGGTIPVGFLAVEGPVTAARMSPMCQGSPSLASNGAIAASAAGNGVELLIYGHSTMAVRAIDEYRLEAARCFPPTALTELTIGAGGFQVMCCKPTRYISVVRFGRSVLVVRDATDRATRRAGDLERTLCVFANDCAPRFGLPAAIGELVAGDEVWAAVLAVDPDPDAPALGRAVATASEMGYRTSAASVDCDDGARVRLGLPAGGDHRYVAVYFGSPEAADEFAAGSTMTPLAVVPVRTYCIG